MAENQPPSAPPAKDRYLLLIHQLGASLYRRNGFRVLHLPVDASARELARRVQAIKMLTKTGWNGTGQTVRTGIPADLEPDGDEVREAVQRLRDPELRLLDEFFWFWPDRSRESPTWTEFATVLKENDRHRAVSLLYRFRKQARRKPVLGHNLAVLAHALALDLERMGLTRSLSEEDRHWMELFWSYAYRQWRASLDHEDLWRWLRERVRQIGDPRVTTGIVRRLRAALPTALLSINAKLCVQAAERGFAGKADRHVRLMENAGFPATCVEEAIRMATAPVTEKIKVHCDNARKEAQQDPARGTEISYRLLGETEQSLSIIKSMYALGHPDRQSVCDDVALSVFDCQLGFVPATNNLHASLAVLNRLLTVGESQPVLQRIQENIQVIRDNLECKPCWFCDEYLARGGTDLPIKVRSRSRPDSSAGSMGEGNRYITVLIPRCVRCRSVHMRTRKLSLAGSVFSGLVGLAFAGQTLVGSSDPTTFVLRLAACFLAVGVGYITGHCVARVAAPEGVRPESAKHNFTQVDGQIERGWECECKPVTAR